MKIVHNLLDAIYTCRWESSSFAGNQCKIIGDFVGGRGQKVSLFLLPTLRIFSGHLYRIERLLRYTMTTTASTAAKSTPPSIMNAPKHTRTTKRKTRETQFRFGRAKITISNRTFFYFIFIALKGHLKRAVDFFFLSLRLHLILFLFSLPFSVPPSRVCVCVRVYILCPDGVVWERVRVCTCGPDVKVNRFVRISQVDGGSRSTYRNLYGFEIKPKGSHRYTTIVLDIHLELRWWQSMIIYSPNGIWSIQSL